ncbi:MAG: hypothetical protein ACI8RD_009114, partial [Bacillariaceae sp.]
EQENANMKIVGKKTISSVDASITFILALISYSKINRSRVHCIVSRIIINIHNG